MHKKILGLDLGTNSIGWALVQEDENEENSKIINSGVRIVQYDNFSSTKTGKESKDPHKDFISGKGISPNASRTQKRGARRNLDRYQQRRKELKKHLTNAKIIDEKFCFSRKWKKSAHEIWKLRAQSASEQIDLKDFARVLFAINKKRGYKSNRKAQQGEDLGQAVDGIEIAEILSKKEITVGQYVLAELEKIKEENKSRDKKKQKKYKVPMFYRSDLQEEFDKILDEQKQYHSELNDALKKELKGKNKSKTEDVFKRIFVNQFKEKWLKLWEENKETYPLKFTTEQKEKLEDGTSENIIKFFADVNLELNAIYIAEPKNEQGKKANTEEKKYQFYKWRSDALTKELKLNEVAAILVEINNQINKSSGYLGKISDRSKELDFKNQTVGQYLYEQIKENPHTRLKNQVFYRKNYENEFHKIWKIQKKFYSDILTDELKKHIIKDIFYQRPLKSCKHLVDECEFEKRIYICDKKGKIDELIVEKINGEKIEITKEQKEKLFLKNDNKSIITKEKVFDILGYEKESYKLYFKRIQGIKCCPKSSPLFQEFRIWQNINNLIFKKEKKQFELNQEAKNKLFKAANLKHPITKKEIFEILGYSDEECELKFKQLEGNRTNAKIYTAFQEILEEGDELDFSKMSADKIIEAVENIFNELNINTNILHFNTDLQGNGFDKQPALQFWHVLYSIDDPEAVVKKLEKFGFKKSHAEILSKVVFEQDYCNLSSKALKKILPFLKQGFQYDKACEKAGYRHSDYLTKEENEKRELSPTMEILPKNTLRNPVVEKILNQMVNTVNAIIEEYGKPDEVRLEMARDLKKSAKERAEMTKGINDATKKHENIRKKLKDDFNLSRITRNDIIKYKLYEELKHLGYKTLYTNEYIKPEKLFTKEIDIEHIIPKALICDNSFSNKTLACRYVNLDKGDTTAYDYLESKGSLEDYKKRVEELYKAKKISKTKYDKLLMKQSKIPEGFIERELRETQYIAKKAKSLLRKVFRNVHTTTGSITDRLRNDWKLTEVMKEINLEKYKALGMTYIEKSKPDSQGNIKDLIKIKNWTKRDDHRHHAVDAIITAFTKKQHVDYLNSLNSLKLNEEKLKDTEAVKSDAKYQDLARLKTFEKKWTDRKTDKNGNKKGSLKFNPPYENFKTEVKKTLNNILISFKQNNKAVTKNINKIKAKNKKEGKNYNQITLTPRGRLHKETVYGSVSVNMIKLKKLKIGITFDKQQIEKVTKNIYKEALLKRLEKFDDNSKKAFAGKNSPAKNPILDVNGKKLPEKVKIKWSELEPQYTIRKPIDKDLKIDKIIDKRAKKSNKKSVKDILEERLTEYKQDKNKAFSNLEENPIWLNEEKGISIKRVTIKGVEKTDALGTKKDHLGNEIKDEEGNSIPANFVQTGNNHHVAIYKDEEGNWKGEVVNFWEAVERNRQGYPIIKTEHEKGWEFLFSMAINDYFILGSDDFDPTEIDLPNPENKNLISPHLFRVQKVSKKEYVFRHHLETSINRNISGTSFQKYTSLPNSKNEETHPFSKIIKVRLNRLGNIVEVN